MLNIFDYCDSLSSIVLSNSITEIKDLCFANNNCTSIVIPNSVTRIGEYAFANCWKLESVYIPNSVKSIDEMAFYCCKNLTSIDIPYSVTDIGENAFSECENLKSVNISYPAISIGVNAFLGCWNLQFVTAPNSYRLSKYFSGKHVKFKELIASTDKKYYKCDGGIIDASDKWIIPQGTYNDIIHCADNYLIVKKGGKYGLITFDGKVIITPKYDNLGVAGSGYLKFKLNGSWGIMNYAGKTIIPSSRGYTSIGSLSTSQKTFAYTMNGYKGECNAQGRELSRVKVKTDVTNDNINTPQKQEEKKIIIEHHREPQPMQEWVECHICLGTGICTIYGCNNGWNSGTRMNCLGCRGSGRCSACGGNRGRYVVVYR